MSHLDEHGQPSDYFFNYRRRVGRKIEKAVRYREQGCRIAIVAEDHWVAHSQ